MFTNFDLPEVAFSSCWVDFFFSGWRNSRKDAYCSILYSNLLSVIYVMYLCPLVQQLCNASHSALHVWGLNCQHTSLSFFCLIENDWRLLLAGLEFTSIIFLWPYLLLIFCILYNKWFLLIADLGLYLICHMFYQENKIWLDTNNAIIYFL